MIVAVECGLDNGRNHVLLPLDLHAGPTHVMPDRWYHKLGTRDEGPFSRSELQFLAHREKLAPGDLIRAEDSAGWVEARSIGLVFPSTKTRAAKPTAPKAQPKPSTALAPETLSASRVIRVDSVDEPLQAKAPISQALPPPVPPQRDGKRRRRILIGAVIGAGLALLLLLLLLFRPTTTEHPLVRGDQSGAGQAASADGRGSRVDAATGGASGKGQSHSTTGDVSGNDDAPRSDSGDERQTADNTDEVEQDSPDASQQIPIERPPSTFAITDAPERSLSEGIDRLTARRSRGTGRKGKKGNDAESASGSFTPGFSEHIAVTEVGSDDIGSVLRQLGPGYDRYTNIRTRDLADYENLKRYRVLFINCGGLPAQSEQLKASLRTFVERGGTVYASDLQYPTIAFPFPESEPQPGAACVPQQVDADVVDKGLAKLLGESVVLNFESADWRVADFYGRRVTTYLQGTVRGRDGKVPLLISFPFVKGNVIFTSFHNSTQVSETEEIILKYLVFSAVTASLDSEVERDFRRRGMSRDARDLFSASNETRRFEREYDCKRSGRLEFALVFEDLGAELELRLTGPGGRSFNKRGTSTFHIRVPDAKKGTWKCVVTAVEVPFANFPFTLNIARKRN